MRPDGGYHANLVRVAEVEMYKLQKACTNGIHHGSEAAGDGGMKPKWTIRRWRTSNSYCICHDACPDPVMYSKVYEIGQRTCNSCDAVPPEKLLIALRLLNMGLEEEDFR
jgi:hypothetical protein